MNKAKQSRLESKGWKVGTAEEFLNMQTRPCVCGGEYQICGGDMLGGGVMTRILAICNKCDNFIDGYEKQVGLNSIGIQSIHKSFDTIDEVNEEIRRQNGLKSSSSHTSSV